MWRQTENAAEQTPSENTGKTVSVIPSARPVEPTRLPVVRSKGFPATLADAIVGDVAPEQYAKLSPRETECLEWTAQGKTTWEIAQILRLSDLTVNYYIRNAMKKLAVHTKAHAVSKAAVLGMFG